MWMDITVPLTASLPVYPGDTKFTIRRVREIAADGFALSDMEMCLHNGTHIDAPAHYLVNGKTIDKMPLTLMTGRVLITGEMPSANVPRVFLKRDSLPKNVDARGVTLLGVSGMSVGDDQTHVSLLSSDCWIVENLNIGDVPEGEYEYVCLPLSIPGAEAAPARVLIRRTEP